MKKFIIFFLALILIAIIGNFAMASTDGWYVYKGTNGVHSFSLKFPTNWQARTLGDHRQGFAPNGVYDDLEFEVLEFENQTYTQVINYFSNANTQYLSSTDFIFHTSFNDLVAKKVLFKDVENDKGIAKTLIKHGDLIIALTTPEDGQTTLQSIYNSFTFTDDWNQYIDPAKKFTFTYPSKYHIEKTANKISLKDITNHSSFFEIHIFENKSIMDALDLVKEPNHRLETKAEISFHEIENTISATYTNVANGKKHSYILIGQNSNAYALTNVNIEQNYPHSDYFDQYVEEMLEGFEFFEISTEYHPYLVFPDVRDNHQNADSINYLASYGIIEGYPDKNFHPDDEINRAEITKMVVESVTDVDKNKYNNCFPDVKDEWYAPYVCYAKEKNWIEGYSDDTFRPGNSVNRAESMKIVLEVLIGSSSISETAVLTDTNATDIDDSTWFFKYFVYLNNRDILDKQHIIRGDNLNYEFLPGGHITRKEVAEMIYGLDTF